MPLVATSEEENLANTTLTLHELFTVHGKLTSEEIILDVRNPDEYALGHVPGSLNLPLPELPARSGELKSYARIYIHCKRGGRAKTARDLLASQGFTNLVCIDDAGMDLWIESGYPVKI